MDWEGLETFVAFADHLNFTKAAKAIHLSQPALHTRIQKLQKELGQTLYVRKGRRLFLTPAGEAVARFGREEIERKELFLEDLREGDKHKPLILVAGEGAYLYLLGPGIQRYLQKQSNRLRLYTKSGPEVFAYLQEGRAHIGVAAGHNAPTGLIATELCEVTQGVVCPKNHRLASKQELDWSDIEGESLILPDETRPHRKRIAEGLQEAGVSWQLAMEANGWEVMLSFASLGLGITIVNSCCRIPPDMVYRPLTPLPTLRYRLYHQPQQTQRRGLQELKQHLLSTQTGKPDDNGPH